MGSMMRHGAVSGLFTVAFLVAVTSSQAATTTTTVTGAMGPTAQGCLQQLTQVVGQSENCMYDGGPTNPAPGGISTPTGEVTGPFSQVHYYDSAATPQAFDPAFVPTHDSGQISQVIDGASTITVDDNGTDGNGADDRISFSITFRSPGGGDIIRHLGAAVVDKYATMTQILAPTAVNSATANASGGFDYVIGSEGFPSLLTFNSPTEPEAVPCAGQPFGFMDCPASFNTTATDPDRWSGTTSAGLGSLENNLGPRTTGTLTNPDCASTLGNPPNGTPDCQDSRVSFAPRVIFGLTGGTFEDVGWDQTLLKVSTNASGEVVSFAGFDVQEYQVFGGSIVRCGSDPNPQGPCNSWISGFFCGPGGCANDDGPLLATGNVAAVIDALANDIGFADPVTVTITAQPSQGAAQVLVNGVSGNSGNQADIRIAYTANVGASGTDRFTYQVSDGVSTASATVSLSLDAPTDVSPSIEIWGPDEPPLADVVADQGNASPAFLVTSFIILGNGTADQHVVTVTSQATGGICAITPENGTGQFIYTPNAGFSGPDSCTVTVTDIDGDAASDTVSITVNPTGEVTPDIGGASSLDLWSLTLLAVPVLFRRRRRREVLRGASHAISALAAAGLALVGGSAAAQEEESAGDGLAIQEIVVTARKVEENIKEVPVAVTAFDSAAIEAAGITSLNDVAALTPGLSFFNAIGESLPVPVIRGVAPTDIFGESNAAIFVDGVYIAGREGLNFSQLDVERIEVVKGPQSALYGRTAFSGAINYITKRPSEEFEAKTSVEAGNQDKRKGTVSVSGPILGDSFRGRASVLYDEWDGSYNNSIPGGPDIGGYRYRSYQGSLLWLPAEAWEIGLSYYASNDAIDEPAIIGLPSNCEDRVEPPPNTTDYPVYPGVRFQNFCGQVPDLDSIPGVLGNNTMPKIREALGENRDLDRANLKIDWNLYERGSVTALTGYSKTSQNNKTDFGRGTGYDQPFRYCSTVDDQGVQVPNACRDQFGVPTPANQIFVTGLLDEEPGDVTEEWSQEIRWSSPRDQRLRLTSGAYVFTSNLRHKEGNPIAVTADGNSPLPAGATIGLPPFDPTAPDFAIGTAIFYSTFADDPFTPGYSPDAGTTLGLDPLRRVNDESETDAWAVFTGVDFDLTDRLTFNAELRLSQEAKTAKTNVYAECAPKGYLVPDPNDPDTLIPNPCGDDLVDLRVVNPLETVSASGRFTQWTGRGGLKFQLNDDWMTYGSIAFGEKPGGLRLFQEELAQQDPVTGDDTTFIVDDFDPETITAYEIGGKGYLFDRRVSVDVAVFFNDWKDIVLRQLVNTDAQGRVLEQPAGDNVNAGDASVYGAELQATFNVTENLSGDVTVGWADAEFDKGRQSTYNRFPSFRAEGCFPEDAPPGTPDENKAWFENCNDISGDISGATLLRQPEWKSSASLTYRRSFFDDWQWYARGDVNYQGEVYAGNDNEIWLPSRTLVNTKVGMDSGRYKIEFFVRNLFDDRSAVAAFRDIYFANSDNLYPPFTDQGPRPNFDDFVPFRNSVSYGSGRLFGISAEMRFGALAQ